MPDPVDPVAPVDPVDPVDPVGPADPGGRADPGGPVPRRRGWAPARGLLGGSPLSLLALVASIALAGYAGSKWVPNTHALRLGIWFVGAAVLHDLLLFPLYAIADRSLAEVVQRLPRRAHRNPAVPALNFLRIPAALSLLLLLVFWPAISGQGQTTMMAASGKTDGPFLRRWLLTVAILFAGSAVLYAVRVGQVRHRVAPASVRAAAAPAAAGRPATGLPEAATEEGAHPPVDLDPPAGPRQDGSG